MMESSDEVLLIQFEEYKNKLAALRQPLDELGAALKLDQARNEVEKLEEESAQEGFWNDTENSQKVQKRISALKNKIEIGRASCRERV